MNNISVCTIYAKRQLHLQNLVKSLMRSQIHPDELIIVCMNDYLPDLPATPFKIIATTINTDNYLPLAKARSKAAEIARGNNLIFLDVDCICHQDLVGIFNYHLNKEDALYQGSIRYLSSGWQKYSWTVESLEEQSAFHQLQGTEVIGQTKVSHPYELFWSLCFGVRKKTFMALGGFDSSFIGYGGEDTDFAFTARYNNIPFYKISALAYHQYHPAYDPPLNHLGEIVSNALVFYRKWELLPMKKWLDRFVELGYLKITNNRIEIIRYPTDTEIKACLKE